MPILTSRVVRHIKQLLVTFIEILALRLVSQVGENAAHLFLRDLSRHYASLFPPSRTALEGLLQQVVLQQVLRAAVVVVVRQVHAGNGLHFSRHKQPVHTANRCAVRALHGRRWLARATREDDTVMEPLDLDNEKVVREGLLEVNSRGKRHFVLDEWSVVERRAEREQLIAFLQIAHQRHLLLFRQKVISAFHWRRVYASPCHDAITVSIFRCGVDPVYYEGAHSLIEKQGRLWLAILNLHIMD